MQRRRHCQIGNDGSKAPATGPKTFFTRTHRWPADNHQCRLPGQLPASSLRRPSKPVRHCRSKADASACAAAVRRHKGSDPPPPTTTSASSSLSLMISGTPLPLVVLLFRAYSVRAIEAAGRRRPFRSPASETRRPFPHDRGSTAATSLSPMTGAGGQAGFVISLLMAVGTAPAWFPFFPRRG
jgi:hypothetical protein